MAMATQQPLKEEEGEEEGEEEEEEVKWVNHYSASHQILLVGEGDFSFSSCLALSFGSASNICASSLDSYDDVIKKYKKGRSNIRTLVRMGAFVLHGVNATEMKFHPDLRMRKFDRIVFNFPHAGFYGKEDNSLMIGMHRNLMHGFFKNASQMLRADGEVHVSHKTTPPFDSWNLEDLALRNFLSLIEPVEEFKIQDYPSYNNKRGSGSRCDEPFPLGECSTFKFVLSPAAKKNFRAKSFKGFPYRSSQQLQEIPIQFQREETLFDSRRCKIFLTNQMNAFPGHVRSPLAMNIQRESPRSFYSCFSNVSNDVDCDAHVSSGFDSFGHPQRNVTRNMNDFPGYMGLPLTSDIQRQKERVFHGCFNTVRETHGRIGNHVDYTIHGSQFAGYGRSMENALGGTLNDVDYTAHLSSGFDSFGHTQRNITKNMNDFPGYMGLPLTSEIQREKFSMSDGCFNNVRETHGRAGNHVDYTVHGSHFAGYGRYMENALGRTLNGDLSVINEVRMSTL